MKHYALVAILSAAAYLLFLAVQPSIGLGWDGVQYAQMAAACRAGLPLHADAPFVYRPLAPCIAGWLSDDPLTGFRLLNLISATATGPLLLAWLRRNSIRPHVAIVLFVGFILAPFGPFRLAALLPAYADPLAWPLWIGALLLSDGELTNRRLAALAALTFIGVLVRETLLLPALILLFHDRRARNLLPVLAGLAAFALTHAVGQPTNGYSFFAAAAQSARYNSLATYALGWLIAFGPALALIDRRGLAILRERPALLTLLFAVALLGWIGGSDTERILLWSAPVVLVLIGRSRPRTLVLALALIAQAIAHRWLQLLPSDPAAFLDLTARHATSAAQMAALVWYGVCVGVLVAARVLQPALDKTPVL